MISKACVVGAYQRKLEELAAHPGLELVVAVPPLWRDERGGVTPLERAHLRGYTLVVEPLWFNGNFHLHFYPRLGALMARVRPDIVHLDEEPYNLATWQGWHLARRAGAKTLFFSWQNLLRRYPWPFSWFERDVLHGVQYALMGNQEAAEVWRAKGYAGPLRVVPQFGVDPAIFVPAAAHAAAPRPTFTVGYAGRLVPEKGVEVLLQAVAELPPEVEVSIVGGGPERAKLQQLAQTLGLGARVHFASALPSVQMPNYFAKIDCLVLPSRTRPNWKEQFGRVLIEAMACEVPVIGAHSGEIPNVIGAAGLVFPEGDAGALAAQLRRLMADPALRAELAAQGRARVLQHYTHQRVAAETAEVYEEMMKL